MKIGNIGSILLSEYFLDLLFFLFFIRLKLIEFVLGKI